MMFAPTSTPQMDRQRRKLEVLEALQNYFLACEAAGSIGHPDVDELDQALFSISDMALNVTIKIREAL